MDMNKTCAPPHCPHDLSCASLLRGESVSERTKTVFGNDFSSLHQLLKRRRMDHATRAHSIYSLSPARFCRPRAATAGVRLGALQRRGV
eukprot:scaffold92116_cov29-Tisochrysis_lutea.AAC.1